MCLVVVDFYGFFVFVVDVVDGVVVVWFEEEMIGLFD